jgi:hypothetical protein
MKFTLLLFLLAVSLMSVGQSPGNQGSNVHPTVAPQVLAKQHKALSANPFYQQVIREPSNPSGWLDLYKSVGKMENSIGARKQLLSEISRAAENHIGNSWQFSLLKFLESGRRDSVSIHQALSRANSASQLYPYAIQWALIAGNNNLLKAYCETLQQAEPITVTQYEYHFNVLMSAGKQETIYAKGLTDLVPMLILQQVFKIRTDLHFKFYEETTAPIRGYLCLSLGKDIIAKYPQAHYTGLLVNITAASNELPKNLEANFNWSTLDQLTILPETDKTLYQNYLPPLIILYKQYLQTGDRRAETWLNRIRKIAALTGTTAMVNKQIGL